MIQYFKVKNFLSFRDEATLSFEATEDRTFEGTHVVEVAPEMRLLRFAMLYGANASGKSNLLTAMDFLRKFWFAKKDDLDEPIDVIPFLLDTDTPNQPTEFELKFYVGNVRYWYQLSLDREKVLSEKLYYYRSVQPTMLFFRESFNRTSVIKINQTAVKVSGAVLEQLSLRCLPNMSFFSARNQLNCSLPLIDEAVEWLKTGIHAFVRTNDVVSAFVRRKLQNDSGFKEYLLEFMKRADLNITGIGLKQQQPSQSHYCGERPEFEHTVRNFRGVEKYALPDNLQSGGTIRLIDVESFIYEALRTGTMLSIDEIESSMHPDLVEYVIEQFLKTESRSQLLVTTHYDPLLETVNDLIRMDCVWFTEKEEDGNSKLYSLVEFKGLNKISSIRRSYRNGVFGALPNIVE